jgi:purine-binding chemotaxis protein CheW
MADSKYVVFKLDKEFYGIEIEKVERILPEQAVTRIPRTPKMMLGLFDLRGETIPAIDLRLRFELPERDDTSNFIVVLTEYGRCALRADCVDGIASVDDTSIEENPDIFDKSGDEFIAGIAKVHDNLVVILKPNEVVPLSLRGQVKKHAEKKAA